MGRGKASALVYGSPFESTILGARRGAAPARPEARSQESLLARAQRRIDELAAALAADPVDPSMDPINQRMHEDTRAMQVGILQIAASDPEALWGAWNLKNRAHNAFDGGRRLGSHATNAGLRLLLDEGYLELVERDRVRMIL